LSHRYRPRFPKLIALIGSSLVLATSLAMIPPPISAGAQSTRLVVIPFENESYDNIIGSGQAPYLNQLISQGTLFNNYTALASSSFPNYLGMTSGLTSALTPPSPNIFQAIDASGVTSWKEFMESMTGTCGAGTTGIVPGSPDPLYTTEHDPAFAYQGNTTCTANDVPLTNSTFSPSNLPSFSYVVPNQCNDMHTPVASGQSCPAYFGPNSGTSLINMGDNWLSAVVPSLLAQPNVTVLITWDESSANPQHIVTLEVGAGVTAGGFDANAYNHYGLEAGLYRYFGLGTAPNNGASAVPLPIPASPAPLYPGASNAVTRENSKPGTIGWKLAQQADGYNQQIDGYASATSVNLGQQITFYASVNPGQRFTMDFYRFGYYQGLGGRFMLDVPNLAGVTQPGCPMDSSTGMIACNWSPSYQLTIPSTWVSGVYLARLTNAAGWQSYITFVVRDDSRSSSLLYQLPFNTYQAYNNWPDDIPPNSTTGLPVTGKSLYDTSSSATLTSLGTQRAVEVSYDRPFAGNAGSGAPFLDYDANDIGWLEQQGYDVAYTTSTDMDLSPGSLINHNGFISGAHDEYWSMSMYNNVAQARDNRVNLAFLGADAVSWQVRFAASASGVPDREIICYKSATLDPVQNNTVTVHFHDPQVNVPEQLLVGGNSAGVQQGTSSALPAPYIVQNASSWVYANTSAFNGESIPNVVGYEIQAYNSAFPSPTSAPGTYQLLSSSPIVNTNNATINQNSTIYQAASGAWVFSAGSIEWGWALFDFGFSLGGQSHADYATPFVQTMTANILNKFSAGTLPLPAAPTNLMAVPSASAVNLSWTDNDATATYVLDRSTDQAFNSFTSVSLPAGATSYSDNGLAAGVYYYRLVAVGANGKSPYVSTSAATISYAALVAGRTGLLAHWRLGESSGTTASDTTGTYAGTYVNSPTLGSPGAITNDPNSSVTFNGTNQRVTVPTVPSAGDFSIEGWSFLTNASVNNNTLYGGNGTARLMPRPGTGSFISAAYAAVTLNGTEYALQPTSPASNINTWVYWVLTRQGSQLTLYRNGVQIGQRSDLPATATASINGYIAAQNSGAYYLTGRLQDVALYTRALSSDDVRNGYMAGLNGIAPTPPVLPPAAPTNFRAAPSTSAVSLTWTDSDATSTYLVYRSTDPSFGSFATITLPAGTTGYIDSGLGQGIVYYRLVAVNAGGQSPYVSTNAATISYTAMVNGRSGLLAHWRLGEPSGTTAWDTGGTYNGAYVNGPTLGSPGAIANDPSTSVTFNGSNQRVTVPALPSSVDFSIEGWTYLTNASVNNNTVYGSNTLQFLARPGTGSFPTAAYASVTLNGTAYVLQPNSPASNINTWVDWVVTRQGGTLTLYRNGVQISQRTDLPATATISLSGYLADESNGSYYLTGRLQDVSLYSRALSSLEATNGYLAGLNGAPPSTSPASTTPYYNAVRSEPSLLAYWRLGESSGTAANDVMGKYSGTYASGVTLGSSGVIVNDSDKSATFNGTSGRVTLPSLPTVGDFSIEGWTNLTNASVNNNTMFGNSATQLLARPGTGSFPTAAYAGVTLNGTAYVLQPNSPASNINTWVYWVVTRQGGILTLYRNAVQIGQRTDLPASAGANISGYIGDQIGGNYYLTGGIDEVAVYNSALTAQDITSHYQAAQSGPAPAPTAPPSASVSSPTAASTYGANWLGSITGTASSTSGFSLTAVSVAVRDTTTGQWWGGSGFNQSNQTFFPVTSGTTNWSLGFPASNLTSGHSYSAIAQATDYVGNVGTSAAVGFTYVNTPPSVSVSYPANASTYGTNWAGSINGAALSNSGSSLAGVAVAVRDTTTGQWWSGFGFNQASQTFVPVTSGTTNWSLNFPAASLTSGHGYTVTAQATDNLGNAGTSTSVGFSYTTSPPSTTIACNGAACSSGWYNAPVTVTLSATDAGGPGVSATYYTTDGSTPTTSSTLYTGAFTASTTSPVQFFSADMAGNLESVNAQQVQIDTVAPTTTVACNGAPCSSSYGAPVSVTLSATDNAGGSGITATYYTTDGSAPTTSSTPYTGAFRVSSTSSVQFFSVDNAGNLESVKSQQVQITVILVSIAITPANPSISKGGTQQFTATGTYSDGGSQDLTSSATWLSSNPAAATITAAGLATGVAQGTSQISAGSAGVTGITTLTVGAATLLSIAVTPSNPSIPKGTTQQFTASGNYSDGSTVDLTNSVSWSSSDTSVATITSGGLASALKQGSTTISASSGVTGSTTLTVGPAALVSIAVTPANPSIAKGSTQQFTATGTYSDGGTQDLTSSATWLSSSPAAATITAAGLATGVAQGTSQISAGSGGVTGSTTLAVGPATLVSVAVTPANPAIPKGTTQPFTATGTYSDGSTLDLTSSATWVSSNPAVATIGSGGLASGVAQGTSQVSASSGGLTGSTTLTVGPATLVAIAVTPANPSIAMGTTQQFTATGTYSDSSTQNLTNSVSWSSSDTSVATITSGGLATAVKQGSTTISASGEVTGSTTLAVGPATLVSVAVTPANPSIPKGTTQPFSATGTYSDGSTLDLTSSATWVSSNTAVATISSGGLASGVAQGTSQVSASSGGLTGSTTLTVRPATPVSIAITPSNPSIAKGTTQQFTATGTDSDGSTQDLTSSATWVSSNPAVATITAGGLASGAAQGTSQVSANFGGVTGSTTLTVGPAVLVLVAVTPANPSIAKGTAQQFSATGTYSDGSTQELTGSATWVSSNTAVATITTGGLASGAAQGTSQISATSAAVTGSTTLTVGPPTLVSIALTPTNPSIALGSTQQFTATGSYSDGSMVDVTSSATWVSANTAVATITAGGLASSAAQGTSQISVSLSGVTSSTTLTVGPAGLVSIAVTPGNPSIPKGTTQQFAATGTYSDGTTQNLTSAATWVSANTTVATITAGALASGAAQGTSQISATLAGVTGSTILTIAPPGLLSIAVTPANPSIPKGTTQQFTATGTYTDASTLDVTSSVTWVSSNPAAATITAGGLASGAAQGTSQVSATLAGVTGSTTLTVGPAVLVSIVVTPANPSIAKGATQQFTAAGTYSDGSTQNLTNVVSWASSNTSVATVTSGGLATGVAQSTSEISASSGGVTGSTTLTVGPAVLVSIAVTPANPSIPKGTTRQFTASGTYSDGSTQNLTSSATWASSNTVVATISAAGLATGVTQGTSQITASSAGVTASTTLTVGPAILVSIAVTPVNPSIPKGTTQQFTATGTYSDGSTVDVTSSVTWASSKPSVAPITTSGLATGKAQGTTQISAKLGSVTGSTPLTVGPAALVSITVTPANQSVSVGTKVQYAASGKYTDGSTKNLTTSVTWTSSDTSVATITSAGVATALKSGTVTISAKSGTVVGSTSLTVK